MLAAILIMSSLWSRVCGGHLKPGLRREGASRPAAEDPVPDDRVDDLKKEFVLAANELRTGIAHLRNRTAQSLVDAAGHGHGGGNTGELGADGNVAELADLTARLPRIQARIDEIRKMLDSEKVYLESGNTGTDLSNTLRNLIQAKLDSVKEKIANTSEVLLNTKNTLGGFEDSLSGHVNTESTELLGVVTEIEHDTEKTRELLEKETTGPDVDDINSTYYDSREYNISSHLAAICTGCKGSSAMLTQREKYVTGGTYSQTWDTLSESDRCSEMCSKAMDTCIKQKRRRGDVNSDKLAYAECEYARAKAAYGDDRVDWGPRNRQGSVLMRSSVITGTQYFQDMCGVNCFTASSQYDGGTSIKTILAGHLTGDFSYPEGANLKTFVGVGVGTQIKDCVCKQFEIDQEKSYCTDRLACDPVCVEAMSKCTTVPSKTADECYASLPRKGTCRNPEKWF